MVEEQVQLLACMWTGMIHGGSGRRDAGGVRRRRHGYRAPVGWPIPALMSCLLTIDITATVSKTTGATDACSARIVTVFNVLARLFCGLNIGEKYSWGKIKKIKTQQK